MRQTSLPEFFSVVTTVYVPMRNFAYITRQGLAERQLKRRLTNEGWQVWRGGYLAEGLDSKYACVRLAYAKVAKIIRDFHGKDALEWCWYLCRVHHGMPDFVCYHPQLKSVKFVECKLGHEPLSSRQKQTISVLLDVGFVVEIHKLVEQCTKIRKALTPLWSRKKKVIERQLVLKC